MDYSIDPETGAALVPLRGRRGKGLFTLVDVEDIPMIKGVCWAVLHSKDNQRYVHGYSANRQPKAGSVYLHRLIMGVSNPKQHVDHINHDGIDNRRCNLRVVTHQQNHFNRKPNKNSTSRFKGVSWNRSSNRWRSIIKKNGQKVNVGFFDDEIEAAVAYDAAAIDLFGEYAYLNFPELK